MEAGADKRNASRSMAGSAYLDTEGPSHGRLEGLVIRQKTSKHKRSSRYRGDRLEITQPNQTWAMDFVSDSLFNGTPFRILTMVDCHM